MAGAKQLVTLGFILVPAGGVRPAGVCSGHYIALHCGACRGWATTKSGEEVEPPGPRGTDKGKCQYRGQGGKRASERCPSSHAARGLPLLL
jgi:hypothetical protein